jgi:1-aminocyclopropane-1-carboxylate deaminase/D-cysteine desulfhydrase-like pyridoxal-dependent ACC family enzyme
VAVTPASTSADAALAGAASAGSALTGAASARPLLAAAGALPRTRLAVLPTPLVPAPRLAETLGTGPLLVKRDDLTGFAFGGNKARLLEFLIAGAVADGADTLLTGGAPGSNFCAATAAAARRAGLSCQLVIAGQSGSPEPALALARSWGAAVRWTGVPDRDSVDAQLPAVAARLAAEGRRPYLIPRGGATGLGAVGYALAAAELHEQLAGQPGGYRDVTVVVPTGSGGTLAGLIAGHVLLGRPWALLGASASRPPQAAARQVLDLARQCLRLLGASQSSVGQSSVGQSSVGQSGTDQEASPADITIMDARGPGHGLPSPAGLAAAEQAMRTEGLMLDPVYTAKAMALVPPGRRVVFWHTGGVLDAVAAAQDEAAQDRTAEVSG